MLRPIRQALYTFAKSFDFIFSFCNMQSEALVAVAEGLLERVKETFADNWKSPSRQPRERVATCLPWLRRAQLRRSLSSGVALHSTLSSWIQVLKASWS